MSSVTKVGVLAGLAAIAAADVWRFSVLVVLLLIAAHAISAVAIAIGLVAVFGLEPSLTAILVGALVMDGDIGALLVLCCLPAQRARYGSYRCPLAFERSRRWPRCSPCRVGRVGARLGPGATGSPFDRPYTEVRRGRARALVIRLATTRDHKNLTLLTIR